MAEGYSDYQRIVNWDGPLVWEILTKAITGEANSGVINCARYGYIAGRVSLTGEDFQLRMEWFSDEAATKQLGQMVMTLSPSVQNPAQLRIPNMGPWVRVVLEGKEGAAKCTATARLFLSNRIHPLQLIPVAPMIFRSTHTYAVSENLFIGPFDYYAGPAEVNYETNVAGTVTLVLEAEPAPGVVVAFCILRFTEAQLSGQAKVIIPPGMWRIRVANGAGERTINVNVTASLTGSG